MRGKRCSFAQESFAVILSAAMASPREAIPESKDPVSAIEGVPSGIYRLPILPEQNAHRFQPRRIYCVMEFRQLGRSGLRVPSLSFGTGTFGGGTEFFRAWGASDVAEATRLVSICLEAGVNLFDTADVYSRGASEEILGKAIAGKRNGVLISTKATFPMGDGPNDLGSSRHHIIESCENSLRRLAIDHIDIYHMHGFDALTPIEETLSTLDTLVKSGKV